ncbi:MAG TPA: T9SS type A sorting domain-containing protein [Prolixibacteraceae bacterium]|nr:T9SS type A sorting domain-containing protein [Prolixibacteraceae bacterium]
MNNLFSFSTLFILVLLSSQLFAQQTSRFPILPSSVWRVNYEYSCMDADFSHQEGDSEYKYFVNGDTLIAGRTYFKLYKTGILYLETPFEIKNKYMGAIRDSADRFFYVEAKSEKENLLYNFAASVGEVVCSSPGGMDYVVGEIDTLDDGRKKMYVDIMTVNCGSANCLIEGIGWLGGLLEGNACFSHPGVRGSYLLCYSENEMPVYQSEYARCGKKMSCNNDFTGVKPPVQQKAPEITMLPGRMLDICLSDEPTGLFDIEFFSVDGRKIQRQTSELPGTIDVNGFGRGSFLIRISNEKVIYSTKFVIR